MRARRGFGTALVAALLVVLFWRLRLGTDHVAASDDLYTQLYPMWLKAGEWMRQGHLPLWNPYQLAGQPFLASVLYGVFYPPNLTRLFLPAEMAMELNMLLHQWAGLLFTYLFLREVRVSRAAAALGAVTFVFSGWIVFEATWFTAAIACSPWLPLGLFAVEKLVRGRGWRWSVLLAISVAMPILAGWLQDWLYNVYAIAGYGLLRLGMTARQTRAIPVSAAAAIAAGFVLGVVLAAAQLLPSVELQLLGPRRPGALKMNDLLAFGALRPAQVANWMVDSMPARPRFAYAGIAALLLAPLSLLGRRHRVEAFYFWGLLIAALLVATAPAPSLVLSVYLSLPGVNWFRTPFRVLYLYSFAIAALAAFGCDALVRREIWRPGVLVAVAGVSLAILTQTTIPGLAIWYLIGSVSLIVLSQFLGNRRWQGLAVATLVALATGDLVFANRNPLMRPGQDLSPVNAQSEMFEFIRARQGLDRTLINFAVYNAAEVMAKQGTVRGIYSVTDYEILNLARTGDFFKRMDASKLLGPEGDKRFVGFLDLWANPEALKRLELLSVRFIVIGRYQMAVEELLLGHNWQPVFTSKNGSWKVLENPQVLPRAYVTYNRWWADSAEDAVNFVGRRSFNPWFTTVLEGGDSASPLSPPTVTTGEPIGPAQIVSYGPTRVEIDARASAPGMLVLTDTYYPGWKVTVDGRPETMYRANVLFRAVPISAGQHSVVFTFEPASLRLGAALSALALITCGGLLYVGKRR